MLKYRLSRQKYLLTDGSRKIPKCTKLSYLGKYVFVFLIKKFILKNKK